MGIPPLVDDSVVEENSVDMEDVAGRCVYCYICTQHILFHIFYCCDVPSWLEDEEIEMDMDISVDLQQQLVYQVQEARAGLLQDMDHTSAPVSVVCVRVVCPVRVPHNRPRNSLMCVYWTSFCRHYLLLKSLQVLYLIR